MRLLLTSLVLFLFSPAAFGYLPPELKALFDPLSGTVVTAIGDEYLIDLDPGADLQVGDILTLVSPGQPVRHPITQEILGTIATPIGYLKITRIQSGYSFAKNLRTQSLPTPGMEVRRFEKIPARFISEDSERQDFFSELRQALPRVTWLDPQDPADPLLYFSLEGDTLMIMDGSRAPLYEFSTVPPDSPR